MVVEAVLFDFDGVIADTEPSNSEYVRQAFEHFGVYLTQSEREALIGVNDLWRFEALLSRAQQPVSITVFETYRHSLGNTYDDGAISPEPGLVEVLQYCRRKAVKTAVVSATHTPFIQRALKRLDLAEYFDLVVGGDCVKHNKPDPEPYRHAMECLGVECTKSIVIEDSASGIHSGKAAGATVIAYTGTTTKQNTNEADVVIGSFFDCIAQLEK